jgi:1-acyl-sn-glycerol-3-phosphate acyltransferase
MTRDATRREHVHARDEKGRVLQWLHPTGNSLGSDPTRFDPDAVATVHARAAWLFARGRYFGLSVSGWENVPASPVMIVSNHSGGTTIPDAWGLCFAWYDRFGTTRPIHPAAHEMILGNRFTGPFFSKLGVIRADRDVAKRALAHGHDLLVMPGGDVDVWRPWRDRWRVRFAGRTGYARLALEAGVPIVPVANAGAHESLIVLTDGRRIAEMLKLPELARAHIFPIHLSLPWGLAIGPWPHIPWPVHLRYGFGEAVRPIDAGARPGEPITEAHVARMDELVRTRVQEQLDLLSRDPY